MTECRDWAVNWRNGEAVGVTAFYPDAPVSIQQATKDSHENFQDILDGLQRQEDVYDLFDPQTALNRKFEQVTDRVSLKGGRVYFDLVPVEDVVADHIIRSLNEDSGFDPEPHAKFMERLAANPNEHSREHLFKWLKAENFTINADGKIVGYKGVNMGNPGEYKSTRSGPGVYVDGAPVKGYVPNQPGSVIQMPRDMVTFDPDQTCSAGLHVGTWGYAKGFAQAVLEVEVDPADVVSVPSDSGGQKMRVWRYKVIDVVDAPHQSAVKQGAALQPIEDYYDDDDLEDYDDPDAYDGY